MKRIEHVFARTSATILAAACVICLAVVLQIYHPQGWQRWIGVVIWNAAIHDEVLVTPRAIPSRRELLAAIIRSADDNGERLLRNNLLDSQPSVSVVDQFRIVSLELQDNVGLADVEVDQIAAFRYGTARPYRLTARRRVILSRQAQGWILLERKTLSTLTATSRPWP